MKNQFIFWTVLLFIFTSCNSDSVGSYKEMAPSTSAASKVIFAGKKSPSSNGFATEPSIEEVADESYSKNINPNIPVAQRKIIKIGDYHLEVAEAEPSTVKIEGLVKKHGGFISDMNWTKSNPWIQNSLTIRVPNQNFDDLWIAIGKEGVDTRLKKITSNDVSEEFVDITSRLATKKQVKERYEQILRSKAKSVEDVILAEEKIRVLQEEIDAKEGRLRFLSDQVDWSTINLILFQKRALAVNTVVKKNNFFTKASAGFSNGWSIITECLLVAINIWPLLLGLIGIMVWKRSWLELKIRRRNTTV